MSPDLFPPVAFSIKPEAGRTEPRLWVRRLVIWVDPKTAIRDIQLKRGLNIIWSPDPRTTDAGMGHGGGKTTFCRLLRYCLGEDSFASESQRHRISEKFPKGYVGAEVMIEGQLWAVVRSLGPRRRDVVMENVSVEEALSQTASPTGIEPLLEVLTKAILGDAAKLMPSSVGESRAWEAALAWTTRDQECRFGDHLHWRDPNTDSRSPVRQLSASELLMIVRALIGALTMREISTQQRLEIDEKEAATRRQELDRLNWQLARARSSLVSNLGAPEKGNPQSPLETDALKAMAMESLARALKLPTGHNTTDIDKARRERDAVAEDRRRLEGELSNTRTRLDEKSRSLAMMRAEHGGVWNQLVTEQNPICPICEVPIDRALAKGCGISTATCDLHALQKSIARLREHVEAEELEAKKLRGIVPDLERNIALATQQLQPLEETVKILERAERERSETVRNARGALYEVERYAALLAEESAADETVTTVSKRLDEARANLAVDRASVSEQIRHLSLLFSDVLRELVPGEIKGEAKLDGNGLSLKVELGGERSTAAIDSLKVVAFDLAALVMSIEGLTSMPGFLLHDSPREADLGLSIYHRLFEFARKLQHFGPAPLFQYIVTTTTEPPREFLDEEWRRLTIHGAPASERLLLVDL
jgi:hypothetical protein